MKTVALRRLSTVPITTGLGLPGNNFEQSDPRYIRTTDIASPLTLKDDTFVSQPSDVATRAPVEYGDLLLVSAGSSIGKSCLYLSHDPACYAGFLTRVRPESVHTGLFLSYWTQSAHFVDQVRSTAVQATIENFSASRYKDLRVPVVPNDQQKRIVRFLDAETAKIDHLIAKQRKLLKLFDLRNEARWQEAFTGFTPLKRLPLKRLLVKQYRPVVEGAGVVTAFRDGEVTLRSNRREEGFTFSESETGYQGVVAGDLVFHGLDGFAGAVGISDSNGQSTPVYHVCRLRNDEDDLRFIAYLLRYLGNSGFLAAQAPSVRQRAVDFRNWQTFGRIPLSLPQGRVQQRIVSELDESAKALADAKATIERALGLLQERRSALITAAVTGQIEV
ncbi:type I restriction endonuclease subunit S [Corynebacterium diphtheriae]|nr:type I restriction endonuclease subunit S [Corynebacterium diphtheriae]CAB0672119.1 type I restriction endonuclease subunit S [Corynebacterium diphtheriae]CAB0672514.1 type I restriction endonuclease subunit S [Corynebacterium diphtheriae]